jgi:hypothetical protein
MNNSKPAPAREVDPKDLSELDFGACSLALGVALEGGTPWVGLDRDDLRILAKSLRTRPRHDVQAPAECSEGLHLLMLWADAGAEWLRRRGLGD